MAKIDKVVSMVRAKTYRVTGKMRLRNGERVRFTIEVRGVSEEEAREKVYSNLGSRHKLKRRHIYIEKIEEVEKLEDIKNTYVQQLAAADKIIVF